MPEFRHARSRSLNIPSSARPANASPNAAPRFEGPRSPPSTCNPDLLLSPAYTTIRRALGPSRGTRRHSRHQILTVAVTDTSHVPCKFFRQGTCQAGKACPFSHDLGSASETICKYFAKVRSAVYIQLGCCAPRHDLNKLIDGLSVRSSLASRTCLSVSLYRLYANLSSQSGKLQVRPEMRQHSCSS